MSWQASSGLWVQGFGRGSGVGVCVGGGWVLGKLQDFKVLPGFWIVGAW